ncbi:transposase family protein [Paenibacillus antibioticophila]|uniref:transposase family protein n=1 Tax=Paenibacillus antibioticophila TaxID=1274374 RepID=UPI0035B565AF
MNFKVGHIAENEYDFQIKVETYSPPSHCPQCGCVANFYKHDHREQLCTDLPIRKACRAYRKASEVSMQRLQTYLLRTLRPPIDEKRNCTKRLLKYIEKQDLNGEYYFNLDEIRVQVKV